MRRELGDHRRDAAMDGIQEHEQVYLDMKEHKIREQEEKIQELHKDLQQQSKDVLQMKSEVAKHEASEQVVNNIKVKLNSLPEGAEKEEAIAKAHKDLDTVKRAQGIIDETPLKPADVNAPPVP
uniref:Uncharacterized protein n=1 Tax=Ciona savignyi TaxID=51511 RepID=H2YER4_CIOSA